ncbi:GPW/gp25 family protein [Flavobacterium sp. NRK F7]|uniref:GPW/gp25 family protein n=1 Tax=Flavobacterium sp. NRK F7 TaxID=2954930 RepID=UPI002091CEB6|nr:GPW/gp25 family protein [Flavobacterium sp. NRK F7]MCO6161217.1 GPW/gp25 family protein [Flavobacterium sp. NRK F7]
MKEKSFLGTGWSFPPTFKNQTGTIEMVSDENDIFQSLQILLSTELKERIMRSDYGCDLNALLYESITITLLTKIKGIIENAILKYEPRIDLIEVDFYTEDSSNGVINIVITYKIRATNSRKNYVFPYYLEEGTFVKK